MKNINIQENEALVTAVVVDGNPAILAKDDFNPGKSNCIVELGIEKDSKSAVRMEDAYQAALTHGEKHLYGKGYSLIEPKSPIYDGDEEVLRKPMAKDKMVVHAKSSTIPLLFDQDGHEDTEPNDWGVGTKVKALIAFYPYCIEGKKGVSAKVKFMGLVEKSQIVPMHDVALSLLSSFDED